MLKTNSLMNCSQIRICSVVPGGGLGCRKKTAQEMQLDFYGTAMFSRLMSAIKNFIISGLLGPQQSLVLREAAPLDA